MAALESLNFDVDGALHYIHCVLFNVPMQLSVSELAPMVVPDPNSEIVKEMESIGCHIIPHRLHIYKEPLSTKFGFVTFFIRQTSPPQSTTTTTTTTTSSSVEGESKSIIITPERVHHLVTTWVREDLARQLATLNVKVQLGQPSECYSSVPFLRALNQQCSFLDSKTVKDTKKLETFLLTKVKFGDELINSHKNNNNNSNNNNMEESSDNDNTEVSWNTVGSFPMSSLSSREILWLSRQYRNFPPILVTNNDFANATCDKKALQSFLEDTLNPIVEVVP